MKAISLLATATIGLGACSSEGSESCETQTATIQELCSLMDDCGAFDGSAPELSPAIDVVPGTGIPEEVTTQEAQNNLDMIWHEGRLFFAFRSAPNHFASADTVLYVMSTVDQVNWQYETSFALGTDLREPRFLSFDGKLFLYFAVLGRYAFDFDPKGAKVAEYKGPCEWGEAEDIFEPGFIPWRGKTIDGKPYLIGYTGGGDIYDEQEEERVQVQLLTTENGRDFTPVVPGQPVVLEGGVSETDFVFLNNGDLVAVGRNEAGDEDGWGSKICRAPADDLGAWECAHDPKKYDSPLLFKHNDDVYLVGRRNVTETGNFDLGNEEIPPESRFSSYSIDYWNAPKRCALWKVDPEFLSVEHVLDLPSAGDTCFASAIPMNESQYLIYNYTSPLDDLDLSWIDGQGGATYIYRTVLSLP